MSDYVDVLQWIDDALDAGAPSSAPPLPTGANDIGERFGLNDQERRFLGLMLAAAEHPEAARQVSFATGHEWSDRCLFAFAPQVCVPLDSRVFRFGLVRTVESLGALHFFVDPIVTRWARGLGGLSHDLAGYVAQVSEPPFVDVDVSAVETALERVFGSAVGPILIRATGAPYVDSFVASLGVKIGMPIVRVDYPLSDSQKLSLQRQATYDQFLIHWAVDGPNPTQANFPVQIVEAGCDTGGFHAIEFEVPDPFTDEEVKSKFWKEHDIPAELSRYTIAERELRTALRTGQDLVSRAKRSQRRNLSPFIEYVPTRRTLDDLILSDDETGSLQRMVQEIAYKRTQGVSDLNFFAQQNRHIALLHGPSGTGKTTAASAVADALGMELFRVNMAGIVSKWIGETMKNLQDVIESVADLEGLILFDEADALFAKRTATSDAHDRYANTDSNYLLQLLDRFEGFAVLTSNRLQEVDTAFFRRFQQIVRFRAPDADQQTVIWRRLLEHVDESAMVPFAARIPTVVPLTGAQIEGAVHASVLETRSNGRALDGAALVAGVQKELAKTGDGLSARDIERILG